MAHVPCVGALCCSLRYRTTHVAAVSQTWSCAAGNLICTERQCPLESFLLRYVPSVGAFHASPADPQILVLRERIPERVVHARGMAAKGVFEVTHDVSDLTYADFLSEVSRELGRAAHDAALATPYQQSKGLDVGGPVWRCSILGLSLLRRCSPCAAGSSHRCRTHLCSPKHYIFTPA